MKLSRNLWLVAGAATIVVIGGLVFANQPSRVAEGAIDKLAQATTGKFVATLQLENAQATQQVLGEQGTVEVQLDGVFSRGKENERDQLKADVVVTTKTESVSVTLEGEARFVNDKAYLYIKKSPPALGAFTQLKGQWLELPRGETTQPAAHVTLPDDLFTNVTRVGTDNLDGTSVVKYTATAHEAAVVRMMDSIAALLGTRLTDAQVNSIRGSVQKVGQVPVELWIKRWGSELTQLSALIAVPDGNKMRFTLRLTELNSKVEITAPDNAKPINEAVTATSPKPS